LKILVKKHASIQIYNKDGRPQILIGKNSMSTIHDWTRGKQRTKSDPWRKEMAREAWKRKNGCKEKE
jgi:hypothetical protein